MSALPTWSDMPRQTFDRGQAKPTPPQVPAQDWLLVGTIVLALVFGAALGSAPRVSSVAVSVAVCIALVPWLWAAWLERRSRWLPAWRLMAASLGVLAYAQLASTILVIGDRRAEVAPLWIDLLRICGAALGAAAMAAATRSRRDSGRFEWKSLVSPSVAIAASLLFLIGFALATAQDLSSSAPDWLAATALLALPLCATLICWSAVATPESKPRFRSIRLALGWTTLSIVLAGPALDRLLGESLLSPRTNWAALPAAACLAASAIGNLQSRVNGSYQPLSATGNSTDGVALGQGSWLRALAPYLAVAVAVTIAVARLQSSESRRDDSIALVAALIAMLILVRQVVVQTSNSRAFRRLEQARHELAARANVDPVTDLPNRRALDERLAEEVERALRYKQPLSFCFVDLDHFKQVNDGHGHAAGDAALRQVASILRRTARTIDFVGRFGGEEFVVLVPGTWSEDAAILGERLRRAVAEHTFNLAGNQPLRLTISVGIAGLPEHAPDAASLSERADRALYSAKHSGRNQVVLYEPPS
ncbi:MAG: hypothetical protein QOJ59_791 [Thermomicrobiales bacterium]|nr:hypothetical protein [Thermomicrobiales bacterium]